MRALTVVVMVGLAMMLVTGCGPKKEEVPQMQPAETPMVAPPIEKGPVVVEPTPPSAPTETVTPATGTEKAVGAKTYTVKKGDTLYGLAKRNYGDGKLWTRIFEANKDKIKDKDHLAVGTVLTIPPK